MPDKTLKEIMEDVSNRPMYYRRDGTPIVGNPDDPKGTLEWAKVFENSDRFVDVDMTLYGECLSTVFLGLDHSFTYATPHTPILFETMLFAPVSDELRKAKRERIQKITMSADKAEAIEKMEDFPEEERIKTHFPHDQLQRRYATEAEAKASHRKLKLQSLIPTRWRHFLLWTIGRQADWSFYDDE